MLITAGHRLSWCSLSVETGETYGLIGLNSCWEKPTIKSNSPGLDTGKGARLKYRPIWRERRWQKVPICLNGSATMVAQDMSIIDFTLSLYGGRIARSDIDNRPECWVECAYLSKRAQIYSKGYIKRRVWWYVFDIVPLLILDEPMSSLDPLTRSWVKGWWLERKREPYIIYRTISPILKNYLNRITYTLERFVYWKAIRTCLHHRRTNARKGFLSLISQGEEGGGLMFEISFAHIMFDKIAYSRFALPYGGF